MKEAKQGDGNHLPSGSIGGAIKSLQAEVISQLARIEYQAKRIRELEGALRDLAGPTARALKVLE